VLLWGKSRPVRGAFRFAACVPMLVVGCGGRTTGRCGSATQLASGTATGSPGAACGSASVTSGASASVTSGSTPCQDNGLCDCSNGGTAGGCCACSVASEGVTGDAATGSTGAASGAASESPGGCTDMGTIHANLTGWQCGCNACWCEHDTITKTTVVCPSADASAGKEAGSSEPPSCSPGGPGMTTCGPGGNGTESCCTSLEVTGGTYFRIYDPPDGNANGNAILAADGGPTGEADPATVSSFRLDKYPVTVGRFRQFVSAVLPAGGRTGWLPSADSGKHAHLNGGKGLVNVADDAGLEYEPGWVSSDDSNIAPTDVNLACSGEGSPWTSVAGGQENLPIACVTWQEAYAFCIWDGGFLPSEAEYEYAEAGGSQQREYPWGSTPPGTGNQYAIYRCYYPEGPAGSAMCTTGATNIAPVGTATLGAGLWGQLDLVGEVWEWNLDWFYETYADSYADSCTDCAFLTASSMRVVRVGGFADPASFLQPSSRDQNEPWIRGGAIGFRCARAP
jgi:sulfatase modifying factor 1